MASYLIIDFTVSNSQSHQVFTTSLGLDSLLAKMSVLQTLYHEYFNYSFKKENLASKLINFPKAVYIHKGNS